MVKARTTTIERGSLHGYVTRKHAHFNQKISISHTGGSLSSDGGLVLMREFLDLDSTHSDTYGNQEEAAYNGHYGTTGYHPLVAFDGLTGDFLKAELRPGNVYAACEARGSSSSATSMSSPTSRSPCRRNGYSKPTSSGGRWRTTSRWKSTASSWTRRTAPASARTRPA